MKLNELQKRILELKAERHALLLAHNYQSLEVQQIADFVGDSLQLARKSSEIEGFDMVVFAGVRFMAEMAAILTDIPVYIPAADAWCPLAGWVDADKIRARRDEFPDAPVVVYVNTTAETKAECNVICTSGNAVDVVESLGASQVLFGPDKNLAEYVRRQTDCEIIDIEPRGNCYVHKQFTPEDILRLKDDHPDAIAIAHPECPPDVQDVSDIVGSTGRMVEIVAESSNKKFIIATEVGLVDQLQARHPDKMVIAARPTAVCRSMKKTTLENIVHVLEDLPPDNLVTVPADMID
ncbi:quinolinate synthase NadA, partial [Candidatus Thorarchaeota archaeon]